MELQSSPRVLKSENSDQERLFYLYRISYESYKKNPNQRVKLELNRVKSKLFKELKKEFKYERARISLKDWDLNDLYFLSKKIYQNVGGWTGFREEAWNYNPESFMYFFVDPYTLWVWSINRSKYEITEFENIVLRCRHAICNHISQNLTNHTTLKRVLKHNLKCVTYTTQLNILSKQIFKTFKNKIPWVNNEYSVVDLVKGRVYRMIREKTIEKIKPDSGIECVICMENNEEFRFHPNGYRFHTICGKCLDSLHKLECPFCKIKLIGPLMK